MQNGIAVALPLDTPPSVSVPATGKPAAAPGAAAGIEIAAVGAAVASATTALCYALHQHQQTGGLRPETRRAIGERVAKAAMLQLELGDQDFAVHARGARRVLRQYLDADFFRRHTSEQADAAISFFLDQLLAVVDRVVEDERALRRSN